jgi:hypothetical protein
MGEFAPAGQVDEEQHERIFSINVKAARCLLPSDRTIAT